MDNAPIIKWLQGEEIDAGVIFAIIGIGVIIFTAYWFGISQVRVISLLFVTSPLWLPYVAFGLFYYKWMEMIGMSFYIFSGRTTLEIKLPPEVFKSPEAMENVFNQIHNVANPDNLMQTYIDGKRPLPYSFELVSIGGSVHLFVNVPTKKTRDTFMISLYSQYPGVEITEVPLDYTAEIPNDLEGWEIMAFHMGKKKPSPYPIKTYIDYKMDMLPKEEEKTDPMTPMLEMLGSLNPHERLWIQIIATPHREKNFKNGQLIHKPTWETEVGAEIDRIMNRDPKTKKGLGTGEDNDFGMPLLSPGERSKIEMMERNAGHYAYETGIRWIYAVPKGKFNGDMISRVIRSFSPYDIQGRNAIGVRWRTDYNYKAFSDPLGSKLPSLKREELMYYKLRVYSARTGADTTKIFTAMELATMYHLPGKVALTPTLQRITSTRGEAPGNLPVGNYTNTTL